MPENRFVVWETITKEGSGKWVEWIHVPEGLIHCPMCLSLHECYFKEPNIPMLPQHENCHCYAMEIDSLIVKTLIQTKSDIRKFSEYVFHPDPGQNSGKKALFESWGYNIMDSEWLQKEFEKQAKDKYSKGQYELGRLNEHGQRIGITTELHRKDRNETVTFTSGWIVRPNGTIQLTTPLGRK